MPRRLAVPQTAWFDGWRLAAASATGASHLARATENQDSFQTNLTTLKDPTRRDESRNEPLIICVADGLGSNRHSAAGSALATALGQSCAEAVFHHRPWNRLTEESIEALLRQTLRHVREAWLTAIGSGPARTLPRPRRTALRPRNGRERYETGSAAHSFHTTFILAVLRPPWLAVARVGDGFVVAQSADGKCHLVGGHRPRHEYANTVTTLGQWPPIADFKVVNDRYLRGIAVSTDGLEDSVLSTGAGRLEPKEDFFQTIFAEVASGERDSERTLRLLRSPALRAQTDDDLTLVVASCSDGGRG